MGVVFRAQNIVTGKLVALKWMHSHIAANPDSSTRLLREAQAASRLSHPNVVDVYDIVQDDKALFLVMELLHGETLRAYLRRNRQPKISEFIAMLLPALAGVAAAHDEGVIHRDLKPDNIFLVRTKGALMPTAKVVDFGVAKLDGDLGLTLTGTGFAIGTPMYMSLEQLSGDKHIDARTDVYAFGVMLYEAIAGHVPYTASTLSELAIKVLTTEPVPLKTLRPDVPTSLARLVDWAIAKRREDRIHSAMALLQELEAFAREPSFRGEMTNQDIAAPLLGLHRAADTDTQGSSTKTAPPPRPRLPASPRSEPAARPAAPTAGVLAHAGAVDGAEAPAAGVARTLAPAASGKRGPTLWLGVGILVAAVAVTALVWMRRTEPTAATPRGDQVSEVLPALASHLADAAVQPLGTPQVRQLSVDPIGSEAGAPDGGGVDAESPLAELPHRSEDPDPPPPKPPKPPKPRPPPPSAADVLGF
ncbi:MAG: hypothetical protein RLZZ450_4646 [Pseudomonadota bacterium]